MKVRFFRAATLLTAVLACAPAFGQVANYPLKPVRMVIPYPPGGAVDALARAVSYELTKVCAAVIALVQSSSMFVVARNFPVNTIAELIAAAKAKPGAINFGRWGIA